MRSFKYYIGEAFRGFGRNTVAAVSASLTVACCVFILIAGVCVALNVDYILEQFENKVGIKVFVDDTVSADGVQTLYSMISALPHVTSVDYVSSEDALKEFAGLYKSSQEVFDELSLDNPLRRSFVIKLEGGRYQDAVLANLTSGRMAELGVANVSHARDSMNAFVTINSAVRVVSAVLIATLGALSVVIIMNAIKLAVNNRRVEITIMKYVGATDWFIKWPFVIEGVLIGILGACAAGAAAWPLYARLVSLLLEKVPVLAAMVELKSNMDIFPFVLPVALVLGIFIGVVGSLTSMRRYLTV